MQKRAATSRLSSRPLRLGLVLSCAVALVSCASDAPRPARLALIDPLGILDDVTSDLRLLVLPAAGHACSAGGRLDPELPTTPGVPVTDAVVDITFAIFVTPPTGHRFLEAISEVNLAIKRRFDHEGWQMAFPSVSLYVENPGGLRGLEATRRPD